MADRLSRSKSRTEQGQDRRSSSTKRPGKGSNKPPSLQRVAVDKPRPSLTSDVETPVATGDNLVFDYVNQNPNADQDDNINSNKRDRQKVSPQNNDPQKRLKMDHKEQPKSLASPVTPISQFNAPNVAFQRTNHYAERNVPKLPAIQKNGKSITPRANSSYYFDNKGKRQRYKVEKTYIKTLDTKRT